ncbi:DUF4279 domain-containing protein [Ornithinibacillus halotolerans]|uniref:DUF4279 domain-containing protein n=1 Tax=Ornithinibacillus halotolerans TaxID=1274357 RepID=A0A916RMC5_9BACI|nr:DUF4279 domain-containing protein [Ornithinibacillus halotolerans]GGA60601.1 hypothetical protein GCM10008025_00780 [Ornithinibacillus halotolerans]
MEQTNTYTYFGIESNGQIVSRGLVAYERGIFNPEDITNLLGIQPFQSWNKGDRSKNGREYLFSSWDAEKSDIERLDVGAQILDTIKNLKNKIPLLNQIKEQYDVNFVIMVVQYIRGDEQPHIYMNKEIIEFCYLTDTIINFDTYIDHLDDELAISE